MAHARAHRRRRLAGLVAEADTTAPVRLLADLRNLFAATPADRVATAAIIRHLTALADRPWADYAHGQPLTPRHLGTLLEPFRIRAKQIRQGVNTRKGYLRADVADAFHRYLSPDPHRPCEGTEAGVIRNGARPVPVSGDGRQQSREPAGTVSNVSDAPAEDRGAHEASPS